jgi:iron(III) transport system ATP-binding protein
MIAIQKLVKRFGNVVALDHVDLDIRRAELFFLLGPSGCGKTTLLRHIAGFYRPDEGRILIAGEDVTFTPPFKRNTGMVFQNYALWPHLTVEKNVAFGLEERRLPKSEIRISVREALQSVHSANCPEASSSELHSLVRWSYVRPACFWMNLYPILTRSCDWKCERRSGESAANMG